MKLVLHAIRFLVLCLIRPKKTQNELEYSDFWFKQSQEAFARCMAATTEQEFRDARAQFDLAERRYRQHSRYICP